MVGAPAQSKPLSLAKRTKSVGMQFLITWAAMTMLGACTGAAHGPGNRVADTAAGASGGASPSRDSGAAGAADGSVASSSAPLKTDVAPGGNFDLSVWELQEPVGAVGSPTIIKPAALVGPNGYRDAYFSTDPTDGAMTFWDPENGVTTPNSNYPRSELRELNADGSEANWAPLGTNTLSATLAVTQVPDHVCVGQIHCGTPLQAGVAATTKPLLELYYYANGDIKLGIEKDPSGGQTSYPIANVPLGTRFSYVIQLLGDGTLVLTLDGIAHTFTMPTAFGGYGEYFKAGNYDQSSGTDPNVGAVVKFYALSVTHSP